ncbi:unnamed protein product, partial [Scytosiphon promiscuus]
MMPSLASEDESMGGEDGGSSSGGEDNGGDNDSVVSGSVRSVGSRTGGAGVSGFNGRNFGGLLGSSGGGGRSSPSLSSSGRPGGPMTPYSALTPNPWDFFPGGGGGAFNLGGQSPLTAAGGGQHFGAREGSCAASSKAYRRARAELKRFTSAAKKFPTNVGVVQVHSLGKVRPERGFYALGRLAPVGFRASRTERSPADESLVNCVMDVLEVPVPDDDVGGAAAGGDRDQDGSSGAPGSADASAENGARAGGEAAPPGSSEVTAEGGAGERKEDGRKTMAVFRVTLSGLKGERGTFQDVSAGKAWRAALRSIGAKVAPSGQEDSFPSWEGDGEDVVVAYDDEDGGDATGRSRGRKRWVVVALARTEMPHSPLGDEQARYLADVLRATRVSGKGQLCYHTTGRPKPSSLEISGRIGGAAYVAVTSGRVSDDDGNTTREASDEEECELRRETAKLLHARAGARARVEANSAAIFDITGEVLPPARLPRVKPDPSSLSSLRRHQQQQQQQQQRGTVGGGATNSGLMIGQQQQQQQQQQANGRSSGGVGGGKGGAGGKGVGDLSGGEVGSSKDGSLWYAGFFPPSVRRLLEGLPLVDECKGYVFEVHRAEKTFQRITKANERTKRPVNVTERSTAQLAATGFRRNVLDGRTMIEQLSELERRSDPVAIELAGVWASSYAVVEREMKAAAKEQRQKKVEEERERKKEAKAQEAVARKADLEEKKVERIYKKLEEKVLREQAREKERLSRALRRFFEAEVSKRRTFAKQTLQTRAEAEGMAAILREDACEGLECRTAEQQAAEQRDHDLLQKALDKARKSSTSDAASGDRSSSLPGPEKTDGVNTPRDTGVTKAATISGGDVVLGELGLSQRQVADLLQLWDFLYCFRQQLSEAGFAPGRPPSLKRLAQALNSVDEFPSRPSPGSTEQNDNNDDPDAVKRRKRRDAAVSLLSGMAAALAGLAAPAAVKSLGMTNAEAADPLLIGALHGPFAWAEMARTVLSLHALREVGRDDKDLQPLLLGGGVNPINNKDPKAMLTEADRKTVKLVRMRLEHRWEVAAAAKGLSGPATAAAANSAALHTCPYGSVGALLTRVYSPGQPWCKRGDWRFHLLSVTELDPYNPQDQAAVVSNLRGAVKLIDAAADQAGEPQARGADPKAGAARGDEQAAAAAAARVTESRHFSTLRAALDRHPERFPSPAGTLAADQALLHKPLKVDVPLCHAAALSILSGLEGSPTSGRGGGGGGGGVLAPPFPPPSSSSEGQGDEGKGGKRPRDGGGGEGRRTTSASKPGGSSGAGASAEAGDGSTSSPSAKRLKIEDEGGGGGGGKAEKAASALGWQQAGKAPGRDGEA